MNYDFTACLSSIDFELLSKDLLEAELGIQLENFKDGRDKGIDLRYTSTKSYNLIVQCKRYSKFSDLKSVLKKTEYIKIKKLNPNRYILTTSVSLSPNQTDEIISILSPYVKSSNDIYGKERLNSILSKYQDIERRHIKLWLSGSGIIDSIINAKTYTISKEEVERTVESAKIFVQNESMNNALSILHKHKVCIIAGQPGIGKTTLARMLLLYYLQNKFDIIKIESDISEARNMA